MNNKRKIKKKKTFLTPEPTFHSSSCSARVAWHILGSAGSDNRLGKKQ
jgi:hypothetical protein